MLSGGSAGGSCVWRFWEMVMIRNRPCVLWCGLIERPTSTSSGQGALMRSTLISWSQQRVGGLPALFHMSRRLGTLARQGRLPGDWWWRCGREMSSSTSRRFTAELDSAVLRCIINCGDMPPKSAPPCYKNGIASPMTSSELSLWYCERRTGYTT